MLPVKALKLALARVVVTRFEGLLCRAVHSGTLYGFSRSEKEGAIVCFTSEVRLEAVLDLTNSAVQKALGTDDHELNNPWRYRKKRGVPPTHRLGQAIAAARRFEAVRFRSSKGDGDCFMILTEGLVAPSFVKVNDPISLLTQRIP